MLKRAKIKNKLYKLDITNTLELQNMATKLRVKLVGNKIYMKDQIPVSLPDGNYIMNLDDSDNLGTHWVAFIRNGRQLFYNDSFGAISPQGITDLFRDNKLQLYYNTQQNQSIKSSSCGYWALFWLDYMIDPKHGKSYRERFDKWNKMFIGGKQELNEKKLLNYVNNILF